MLVNVSSIVLTALAAASSVMARQSLRLRAADASSALWKPFAESTCKSSELSVNMQSGDFDELLEKLGEQDDVVVPSGGATGNTQLYYCNSVAVIFSNDGDTDKRVGLKDMADMLTEAAAKLDRCEGHREKESEYFKTVSNDEDEVPLGIWIRGPEIIDGVYWDSHSAIKTASDKERIHQICDYPETMN